MAPRPSERSVICDINYVGVETGGLSRSAASHIFLQRRRPGPTRVKITGVPFWKNQAEIVPVSVALSSSYRSLSFL